MAKKTAEVIKEPKKTKKSTKTKSKKVVKPTELYYFYSVGCAFCKRIDPIVEQLNKDGYDILRLDVGEKDNQGLHREIENKYDLRCGTPFLVDGSNGKNICGQATEEMIKAWVNGEEIPEPLKPKGAPPPPPKDYSNEEEVSTWKDGYDKWIKENNHMPDLPKTDVMLENLKKRQEILERQQNINPMETKINSLEIKLDKLIKHLGVK